jgi:spore maturation protein SpmB
LSADNGTGRPGDEVTVTLTYTSGGGALGLLTSTVNKLGALAGVSIPTTVTLHSSATGVYE